MSKDTYVYIDISMTSSTGMFMPHVLAVREKISDETPLNMHAGAPIICSTFRDLTNNPPPHTIIT